jgi:hypothetical protein
MMHQMNRSATARKLEDPDGFRRTPVSAPQMMIHQMNHL